MYVRNTTTRIEIMLSIVYDTQNTFTTPFLNFISLKPNRQHRRLTRKRQTDMLKKLFKGDYRRTPTPIYVLHDL